MLKALYVILCVGFFASCERESSLDVNQDKIYTDYELFYNSNTDKTVVVAQFRFGGPTGTLLELMDPASVTFEGDVLSYNVLYNGHAKEYAGQLTGGTFTYVDGDANTFINSVPSYESIQFPNDFTTLKKSEAYDLQWDGTPLSADQWVGLFIGTWTWGQDALFLQNSVGADNLILGVNQMSNLAVGNSTVYMDRATGVEVTQGTSEGGRIRGKFRATNATVMIEE